MGTMSCPVCNGQARTGHAVGESTNYRCSCGLQFLSAGIDVSAVYGDDYFFGRGAGYANYLREGPLITARGRHYAHIVAHHAAPGRLLDVGAAAGFILRGFQDCGWNGVGIEPNTTMATYARQISGVPVQVGTLEDFSAEGQFDLVLMVQVLEHVRDLQQATATAARVTRPGGLWFLSTIDGGSLLAKAMGGAWQGYAPPSVLRIFSRPALDRLMGGLGFARIARGRPVIWISGAHAKSILAYRAGEGLVNSALAGLARVIPDGLALPYPGLDFSWSLYRKSVTSS